MLLSYKVKTPISLAFKFKLGVTVCVVKSNVPPCVMTSIVTTGSPLKTL